MNSNTVKIIIVAILLVVGLSLHVSGQTETTVDCSSVAKIAKPKNNKILSLGVINGKAIDLVKPEFPATARAVRVHGTVEVAIIIDTRGCVSEANALSGHPLLIPASIKAALKSTFSPTTLSSSRIWVNGIIIYNFIPATLNWFELGLISGQFEKLDDFLPAGFDRQKSELRQAEQLTFDYRQKEHARVLDSIRAELTSQPKNQWLFDVGRKLNEISRFNWMGIEGLNEKKRELQQILDIAPDKIPEVMLSRLRELIVETDTNRFWKLMKNIKSMSYSFAS